MQIAVCDDSKDELAHVASLLEAYRQGRNASISYRCFRSATELLSVVEGSDFALFLLDVMMPGIDGLEAARELRNIDPAAKFVFLTASPEFAVMSYEVQALDYILKPVPQGRLFQVLDNLLNEYQRPHEGLSVKTKAGIMRILFSKLAFVEAAGRQVRFHLADGSVREVPGTFGEFEPLLLVHSEFMQVHRAYIVNLWQVSALTASELITHTGRHIPVSRRLYTTVRDTYVEQLWGSKEEEPQI